MSLSLPPLSLYIHIPWCIQKCPYCDFNSHAVKQGIPEQEYIAHRTLSSIFIGGGTPSVFSAAGITQILDGVKQRLPVAADLEVTMEANPGTFEAERFAGYVAGGVTRFSIGVQSFQSEQLKALERIHNAEEAKAAARLAATLPLSSFNLDLMHGLPGQTLEGALADLQQAIALNPPHLQQGAELLAAAGYQQYETSAYSQAGHQCRHNLNYWRYGDYLGIGCGAHGKITLPSRNSILRTVKIKHPKGYMDLSRGYLDERTQVEPEDRPFEFFMNRFRLLEPCPISDFSALTGLPLASISAPLAEAEQKQLITVSQQHWQITAKGARYLNDLLTLFI
ncbi:MAG: YggW family oxidoreductase [Alishewanella sp. 34-51-39]|nr:MAG: YggW family oxidoreductase [Alishewanella sp. 34-51-39]